MNIRPGSEARLLLPATPDPKFRNDWGLQWSTMVYHGLPWPTRPTTSSISPLILRRSQLSANLIQA